MFLDGTYFQGNLTLPQYGRQPKSAVKGEIGAVLTQTVGEQTLEWFIARYEEKFLVKLLGMPLYGAWVQGLVAQPPVQIWVDLKSRIFRTVGGITLSPAANYVYWFAMQQVVSDTTATGEKRQKGTFTDNVSPARKMASAWNEMVADVNHIREWIYIHREDIAAAMTGCVDFREWCSGEFTPINVYGI